MKLLIAIAISATLLTFCTGCTTTTTSDGKTVRKLDTATAVEVAEEAAPLIERLWKLFEKRKAEAPADPEGLEK